ncbi:ATP-dependent RNA helicase RhlE [Pelagimonas phthalicica]|uniref:ATP-dependent RNA helicase RhlE n=2 Tax=Pelagimonas phthalicica TaxID=1037362 RepID=A0A238J873_9RHOB|nr:ATP-dependent RNA helicase RhlE [Pelagimonas phthalicica]SMX26920.1 ATP-dependent RNA helicase RhlE [Pelagimonas phthalicica]
MCGIDQWRSRALPLRTKGMTLSEFEPLGIMPNLTKALTEAGLTKPTPIQEKAIPLALQGRDVLGLAQTGTGKTLAFGLPLLNTLMSDPVKPAAKSVKALILAPTRELVNQIADNLKALTQKSHLKVRTVVGGQSINRQINMLERGADVLVATPGRLIDLMDRKAVKLNTVKHLVLDEADQMLDMGFIHALRKIAPALGTPRQTMLFSATMPKQMEELSRAYLDNPEKVQVSPPGKAADKITQSVHFVEKAGKPGKLREILSQDPDALTLVFARTKHGAERLMKGLVADGFNAASIHGNKSQGQRDRAIKGFRDGDINILVATDVAARGIDIPGVAYVVNFDLPEVAENYVHRIGRTARAGRDGEAIAFCAADEVLLLRQIQKVMKLDIPVASGVEPEPVDRPKPQRGGRGRSGGGRGKPRGGAGNAAGKPAGKPKARRQKHRSPQAGA